MVERQKSGFGQRGMAAPPAGVRPSPRQVASSPPNSHVIYREGETERPTFHGSHIETHWPKYGAGLAAIFALSYLIYDGKRDLFGLVLVPVLFAAISYFAMNGFRKSLNNVHLVRTQLFRSPSFIVGAAIGLGYFIYSTFIDPQMVMGVEWGVQTAFSDGFQQQDFGAVAMLVLKCAGYMVGGGLIVDFIARRFLGQAESQN
jgi:hypothetical protein